MAAAASGTLMRKTSRHDPVSTSHPPRNGPTAVETPARPDQAPTARARSSGWNVAEMIERLLGTSSAPAIPCTARAAISTPMEGARAQRADETPNAASPATKSRLRP